MAGAWPKLEVGGWGWAGDEDCLAVAMLDLALWASRCRGVNDPSQWKEDLWSTVCGETLETRVTPPASRGFHHFFNCSPKGSVCLKVLSNLR